MPNVFVGNENFCVESTSQGALLTNSVCSGCSDLFYIFTGGCGDKKDHRPAPAPTAAAAPVLVSVLIIDIFTICQTVRSRETGSRVIDYKVRGRGNWGLAYGVRAGR